MLALVTSLRREALGRKEDLVIVMKDVEIEVGVLPTDGWTDHPSRNPTAQRQNANP